MNTLLIRTHDSFAMMILNGFSADWVISETRLRNNISRVIIYNFSGTERLICDFAGYRLVQVNGNERKRIFIKNITREFCNVQWYRDLHKQANPIAYL
jgi:hypothetical protein